MIIGHDKLLELFPNFKEDIKENGIDLSIGQLETISNAPQDIGSVDDKKYLPHLEKVPINHGQYRLKMKKHYIVTIDRPIHIPEGYCQLYFLRSTLIRCGLILGSAVGDNDFNGTLRFGLYNSGMQSVFLGENERIIQAVTIKTDGTETSYNGDYQNDKIYK
jgi:deoxycytidine triphosphate deaminase